MKDFTIFGDLDITEGRAIVRSIKAADFCTRDEAIAHPCGPTFIMPDVFKGEVLYTHDVMRDLVMKLIEQGSPPPQAATREAMRMALRYMESVGQSDMFPEEWQIVIALRAALGEDK